MSMMKCPECGRDISDLAEKCPHCGFPMKPNSTNNISSTSPFPQQPNTSKLNIDYPKQKNSVLGILALIFSILGCTFIIGAILAIVDLCKKNNETKKTCSIIALVICGLWIIVGISGDIGSNSSEQLPNNEIETQVTETQEQEISEPDNNTTIQNNSSPETDQQFDSLEDAFKQGFDDSYHISDENQENIDSIKENISEITNDEDVQEAYENWKKSVKNALGGK